MLPTRSVFRGQLKNKIGKQGRWPNALFLFFSPLVIFLSLRWVIFEPFVIPSESMVPQLLIHDHVIVKKFSYGLKSLWGDGWIMNWDKPKRGDIVVFKYPENKNVYFIKRVVGLPGDVVEIKNRAVKINGEMNELNRVSVEDLAASPYLSEMSEAEYYMEKLPLEKVPHFVRFENRDESSEELMTFEVPKNSYFVMGDNRYNSHDSRFWGYVSFDELVGKAQLIWLSCEDMLVSAPVICNPTSLRKDRFMMTIK